MNFTLRQLEIFLAIAQTENISNAAQMLHMSQSAASGALKTLEDQYDMLLFDRQGKRLHLSEFGRAVRPEAEALLEQARGFQRRLAGHQGMGPLAVGATQTIGQHLLVDLYAHFSVQYPEVKVGMTVENTRGICAQVLNFDLDLGMIEGEVNHQQLITNPWREDELVVFAAPDHPLAQKVSLDDDDLCGANWVLREPGSGTRQVFDAAMRGLVSNLHVSLELQHGDAIKRAVALGMGLGCLSRMALNHEFLEGKFVPLAVPQRDFSRRLYIVRHKDKCLSASAEAWIKVSHAVVSQ